MLPKQIANYAMYLVKSIRSGIADHPDEYGPDQIAFLESFAAQLERFATMVLGGNEAAAKDLGDILNYIVNFDENDPRYNEINPASSEDGTDCGMRR